MLAVAVQLAGLYAEMTTAFGDGDHPIRGQE
jgi:hypothetical protein